MGAAAGQGGPGRRGATARTHGKESKGGESRAVPPKLLSLKGSGWRDLALGCQGILAHIGGRSLLCVRCHYLRLGCIISEEL